MFSCQRGELVRDFFSAHCDDTYILWGPDGTLPKTVAFTSRVHLIKRPWGKKWKGDGHLNSLKDDWTSLLSITFNADVQIFCSQLNQVATAWGFDGGHQMHVAALWRSVMRCRVELNSCQSQSGVKQKPFFHWRKPSVLFWSSAFICENAIQF